MYSVKKGMKSLIPILASNRQTCTNIQGIPELKIIKNIYMKCVFFYLFIVFVYRDIQLK